MLGSAVKTSIGTRFILGSGKRALYKNALLPSQNTPKFTNICQQCRLSSYFTSLSQFSSRKSIQQQQQISRSYSVNATVVKKPPSSSSSSSNSRIPRAKKAVLTLTQAAVNQLKALQTPDGDPRILRVGVKNRGCSGLTYTLDYVTKKERFDEVVVQDGKNWSFILLSFCIL